MTRHPRGVDEAIGRFDERAARLDGHPPAASAAVRRHYGRSARIVGRRLANIGMAIGALIVATIAFGLFVSPIGWTGLFLVAVAMLFILIFFSVWRSAGPVVDYKEDMPNRAVVQRLDSLIVRSEEHTSAPVTNAP